MGLLDNGVLELLQRRLKEGSFRPGELTLHGGGWPGDGSTSTGVLASPFAQALGQTQTRADPYLTEAGSFGGTSPQSCEIYVADPSERIAVQDWINRGSTRQYAFDDKGFLRPSTAVPTDGKPRSDYYSDRTDAAIASPNRGIIDIADEFILPKGEVRRLDSSGGGMTFGSPFPSSGLTVISGKNQHVIEPTGPAIDMQAWEVAMHELLAHLYPMLAGSDTGNGIENENKARRQIGLPLRAPNDKHKEFDIP